MALGQEKSPTRLCPFLVLAEHPSGDGDEGDPQWISRWTTNWRANLRYADDSTAWSSVAVRGQRFASQSVEVGGGEPL